MRRILSFLSMVATLLALVFLGIPSVMDSPNLGLEFKGGYEIVYEVTDKEGNSSRDIANVAAEVIATRIDIAGVRNPNISIEGENSQYIRVAVASSDDDALDEVTSLIETDATITFTNSSGEVLMDGSVLKEKDGAVLSYDNGQPIVLLNIKDTATFGEVTGNLVGQNMMIWIGYDDGSNDPNNYSDFYYYSNPGVDQERAEQAARKIIVNATVNQALTDSTAQITGSFTAEQATQISKLLSAGAMKFSLTRGDILRVSGSFGNNSFNRSVIAGLVGLILIIGMMILIYRIPGVISAITLLVYVVGTLLIFNLLGGEYGPDTIAAIVIGIGMAVDACIVLFERIRDELYKGRSVKAAYEEGTKKSFSSILDANITTLIAALALYFFGQRSVKGFATMLLISIVLTLIVMLLITRLLLKLIVKSGVLDNRKTWFGVKQQYIPDINKGEVQTYFGKTANFNFMKKSKFAFIGVGSIFLIGAIFMMAFGFSGNRAMNFGLDFVEGANITISIKDTEHFDNNELEVFQNNEGKFDKVAVERFFNDFNAQNGADVKVSNTMVETYTDVNEEGNDINCVDIKVEYKEYFDKLPLIEELFPDELELSGDWEDYITITPNVTSPMMAKMTVRNALFSLALAAVLIVIYIAIRFRFTYAIAAILALLNDVIVTIALFAIFRIEVSVVFVSAILAIIGYSINNTIIIFDRVRELCKETNHGQINQADRFDIVNRSLSNTFNRSIYTTITTLLPVICLMIIGTSATLNFTLAILFGLLSGLVTSMFIAPRVWLFLERKHVIKVKEKASKRVTKAKNKAKTETEELMIPGIND